MLCQFEELKNKEVINISSGLKIGFVDDIEIDTTNSNIVNMIVYGRPRFFGLFGREDDILINFNDIKLIGEDTILVLLENSAICTKSKEFQLKNLLK